jgi:hypothetical protein
VLPRHQTLQASIDWSHELLSDPERTALRRLSVFAGGWTLDAADQVCPGEGIYRHDVLDLMTGLVDKSLVTTHDQGPQTRYGLLETVRQYATARLADAGELDAMRDRHLAYHLTLAEAADPQALDAERDDPGQHDLAAELPNLRAALERAASTDPTAGLQLVNALTLFWLFTGRYRQGDIAYARALDAAGEEPTPLARAGAVRSRDPRPVRRRLRGRLRVGAGGAGDRRGVRRPTGAGKGLFHSQVDGQLSRPNRRPALAGTQRAAGHPSRRRLVRDHCRSVPRDRLDVARRVRHRSPDTR